MKAKLQKFVLCLIIGIILLTNTSCDDPKAKVTAQDGTYTAYDNGIVFDAKTNLEWLVGPDEDTSWEDAKAWAEDLSIDGGGWRIPKIEELRGLYKKGKGTRNMTPLLKTTGWFVWSRDVEDAISETWGFNFHSDIGRQLNRNTSFTRVFAVRSRRKTEDPNTPTSPK